jgi:hypothetical protein
MSFNFPSSKTPGSPPVTPRTAWNQKPSSSENKVLRASRPRAKPLQIATHQRSHSTGVNPAQQLKVEHVEAPLKKAKVSNAELIDRFVTWLRGDDGGRQVDLKFIDQLGQALNFKAVRYELIPYINQFASEEIAIAVARLGQIDDRELKSDRLYSICLGALFAREDALKTLKQPVLSSGRVSEPSKEPGTFSVKKAVQTYEAKVDASKTLPELRAEGAQLLKAYVAALVEGDKQEPTALMERLAEIIEQIIDMETGKHRRKVISAVIDSWIKGLGLAERKIEERLAIYQRASDLRPDTGLALEVRDSLLGRLEPEVNEAMAQAFISAVSEGDKAEIRQAAVKLQEHCLRRDADPTREDLRERLKTILKDCLKQHPLSADDEKRLRANLPHRSESEAVKILRDLVKGESKVPPLILKLQDLASSIPSPRSPRSPDSPFKSPRKKALAASTPAQQPLSLAASAPSGPRPDPKAVAAMENFIFQLIVGVREGIETSLNELRRVILSLEVGMNALDPLIDAALKDTPTEGLETIAPLIEKGFGVQDVVFKEVQQRLSGRVWAELIVRRLLEHPDDNENADLEAAYNGLNDYLDHDERDLERDVKVQLLFSRALRDRSKKELEILANVHLEKKSQIDKGLMNALLLAKEEESEELIRKKKT